MTKVEPGSQLATVDLLDIVLAVNVLDANGFSDLLGIIDLP